MSNFIEFATLSQSDKETAELAIQEVMELVEDECVSDAERITQPITSLKTVSMLAAYSNVPYAGNVYNLYVAYKHSKLQGAVQSFIVQNTMDDEVWILEDVSHLWDNVIRNLYASKCAIGNAATLEVLDFKEAFKDLKETAASR